MKKIRTLVAYDDEVIKKQIIDILKNIEDVEIVAVSDSAEDTCSKIIDLKPEMVFAKYDFGTKMNGLDIVRESKNILNDNVPVFNMIALDIPKDDYISIKEIIGDKMNTIIREQTQERYIGIVKDYKEYLKGRDNSNN